MSNVPATCNRIRVSLLTGLLSAALTASPILVSESPGTNLQLTLKAINSATSTLHINAYELTSQAIAEAIVEQIKQGVKVTILEEGQPVGGFSKDARERRSEIVNAMNRKGRGNGFYMMEADSVAERRFHFDHAKYILVDNDELLLGSENYSNTGNPEQGNKGNRGWAVLTQEKNIAQHFAGVFKGDCDTTKGDVHRHSGTFDGAPNWLAIPEIEEAPVNRRALTGLEAAKIDIVTAPDNSEKAILDLLNSAKDTIDVELMSFNSKWKDKRSPFFGALVAAAKRGVDIRVLLNDNTVFERRSDKNVKKSNPNLDTVNALNKLTGLKGKLKAKIADIDSMGVTYIHNKGVLVDGNRVLVSSINWTENSVVNNREAALIITSEEVYEHYSKLFNSDWAVSL